MVLYDKLSRDFWKRFDFSPGEVTFTSECLDEDMLEVEYPDKLLLDVGFYCSAGFIHCEFGIMIIWDNDWGTPVADYRCTTEEDFEKLMHMALEQIKKDLEQKRFSACSEPFWDTIRVSYP